MHAHEEMKDAPTEGQKGDNHMKLRIIALAASALALPAAVSIAGSAPSGAVTTPVVFAGTLSGHLTGSISISPGLSLSTPSTVPTTFTTHTKASKLVASKGLTQKGVTITGAKGSSTVTLPAGIDCTTLATSGLPPSVITTKYTVTPTSVTTAAATKFKPGSITVNTSATPLTAVLGGTGTTTTGSFKNGTAGSAASTATLVLNDTTAQLLTACQATGGLTSIAFTGTAGTSTFIFG
jgi:hypothetical protein